jgi:hypothetical protein
MTHHADGYEPIQAGETRREFPLSAADAKRLSKAHTDKGKLQRWVLALYYEHVDNATLPTSARFLFYELRQRGLLARVALRAQVRRPNQYVSEALLVLRKKRFVRWTDIRDETRHTADYRGVADLTGGLRRLLEQVRLDPWQGKPPLLLCESRGVAGSLEPLAYEYGVVVAGTSGQAHGFLVTDIVPRLRPGTRILYLGDADAVGEDIERNTHKVIEQHLAARDVQGVTFTRILLTAEQAEDAGLTPILKKDERYTKRPPYEAIELEAFGQRRIIDAVRTVLDRLLPEPLAAVRARGRPAPGAARAAGRSGRRRAVGRAHVTRRVTHQKVSARSAAATPRKSAASMAWKTQKRSAGW